MRVSEAFVTVRIADYGAKSDADRPGIAGRLLVQRILTTQFCAPALLAPLSRKPAEPAGKLANIVVA